MYSHRYRVMIVPIVLCAQHPLHAIFVIEEIWSMLNWLYVFLLQHQKHQYSFYFHLNHIQYTCCQSDSHVNNASTLTRPSYAKMKYRTACSSIFASCHIYLSKNHSLFLKQIHNVFISLNYIMRTMNLVRRNERMKKFSWMMYWLVVLASFDLSMHGSWIKPFEQKKKNTKIFPIGWLNLRGFSWKVIFTLNIFQIHKSSMNWKIRKRKSEKAKGFLTCFFF